MPYQINKLMAGMGRRTFIILLLGFIVIQIIGLVGVYASYRVIQHRATVQWQVANQVIKIAAIAENISKDQLQYLINALNSPTFHASVNRSPFRDTKTVLNPEPDSIRHAVVGSHNSKSQLSLRLPDGFWLNIESEALKSKWWLFGCYVIAILFMLTCSVLLCLWAVKRLAEPLQTISMAARRLGEDVNAPPLEKIGPIELHQVSETFNDMQSRIRRLVGGRTKMLAAVSHDLRTPITRMKLRLEFIDDETITQKILRDLEDMENMITATLEFARDDFLSEPMEPLDLDALLDAICEDMAETGNQVSYYGLGSRYTFHGKLLGLKRAFTNLIENAVKYGKQAKVSLIVDTHKVMITIEDKGPGIPESEHEQVFEPFYRVENSRSRETGGTGLGLVIVQEVIRLHGGEIKLLNLADGLRVQVTFDT